ncbi:MAG: PilW family protein [Solirubrobacterales bacterium]
MRRLRANEDGFTLIELLVAGAMSIVLIAAAGSVMIGALRAQPKVAQGAANIQSARWVLERMTRELRQGIRFYGTQTASRVSFETYVRHETCGGTAMLSKSAASRACAVTYNCAAGICTRTEVNPPTVEGQAPAAGTPLTMFEGITNTASVFSYLPSISSPTFVEAKLEIPNTEGGAVLKVSDGAALRGLTLTN